MLLVLSRRAHRSIIYFSKNHPAGIIFGNISKINFLTATRSRQEHIAEHCY